MRRRTPIAVLVLALLLAAPTGTRAEEVTPPATPGAAPETLIDLTIPAALLPPPPRQLALAIARWDPGASYAGAGAQGTDRRLVINAVLTGRYVLRIEAGTVVARAGDAAAEAVPAGTELTLGPGDVILFPDAAREQRNAGDEPLEIATVLLLGRGTPPPLGPMRVQGLTGAGIELGAPVVTAVAEELLGPFAVRVRRLTLLPGEEAPAPPAGTVQLVGPAAVGPAVTEATPGGGARNAGDAPVAVHVLTLTQAPGGTPAAAPAT